MAYTPITICPSTLKYFQWATPTNPNPRLAAPISATDTTITVTSAPLDYDGSAITGNFIMGIKNDAGYVEHVYVPDGKVSGTTISDVVRGIRLAGLDYTTAGTSLAVDFNQDAPVFCNIAAFHYQAQLSALNGTVASGGTSWKIGDGTDSDIKIYAWNADTNKPFWEYDKDTNQWVFSNDGVSSSPFGTGAGVTGGDGITVTAGDIDIDLTDTTIFKAVSDGVGDAGKAVKFDTDGYVDDASVQKLKDVTSDAAELNKLDGASANVTAANLNTLTGGGATVLHKHTTYSATGSSNGTNASTITLAHGLGVIPSFVKLTCISTGDPEYNISSTGTYNGSAYACVATYKMGNPAYAATTKDDRIGYINTNTTNSSDYGTIITVTTLNATNIVLTNTVSSGSAGAYVYLVEAFY